MRKILMAAATLALFAAPAFAANKTPQTQSSGPGSAGSTQEQDMNRSNMQSDQNAQAPGTQPTPRGGINTENGNGSSGASGSMNPQQNPHNMRKEK